jgi:hypothetical protein
MEITQLRKNDVSATNLLFGLLAFGAVITFLRVVILKADNPFLGTKHFGPAIEYALSTGLYYTIRLGERWARL